MDKSGIRTVIHYTLPSSVEAYLQESGRAGRDREACRAILLFHPEDRLREEKNPSTELRKRYERLLTFAEDSETCRRESLLAILEAEPEDCDSCDVCCGTVMIKDPVEDLVTEVVSKYRKRFTSGLLRDFLLGRNSREIRQGYWYRASGFGCLDGWITDDIKGMIRGLTDTGRIQEISRGSRKGKLYY